MVKIPAMTMYFKNSVRLQEAMESRSMKQFINLGIDLTSGIKEVLHGLVRHALIQGLNPVKDRENQA